MLKVERHVETKFFGPTSCTAATYYKKGNWIFKTCTTDYGKSSFCV